MRYTLGLQTMSSMKDAANAVAGCEATRSATASVSLERFHRTRAGIASGSRKPMRTASSLMRAAGKRPFRVRAALLEAAGMRREKRSERMQVLQEHQPGWS